VGMVPEAGKVGHGFHGLHGVETQTALLKIVFVGLAKP